MCPRPAATPSKISKSFGGSWRSSARRCWRSRSWWRRTRLTSRAAARGGKRCRPSAGGKGCRSWLSPLCAATAWRRCATSWGRGCGEQPRVPRPPRRLRSKSTRVSGTRRPTPGRTRRRKLRVGIFGGTFDPIHNGHLAVARAAQRRFRLDLIYFVPCGQPPHKRDPELSDYLHRFAMVALACGGERRFLPSLLEAGPDLRGRRRYYSIETVRRLRRLLGSEARLYFLLGA